MINEGEKPEKEKEIDTSQNEQKHDNPEIVE